MPTPSKTAVLNSMKKWLEGAAERLGIIVIGGDRHLHLDGLPETSVFFMDKEEDARNYYETVTFALTPTHVMRATIRTPISSHAWTITKSIYYSTPEELEEAIIRVIERDLGMWAQEKPVVEEVPLQTMADKLAKKIRKRKEGQG